MMWRKVGFAGDAVSDKVLIVWLPVNLLYLPMVCRVTSRGVCAEALFLWAGISCRDVCMPDSMDRLPWCGHWGK